MNRVTLIRNRVYSISKKVSVAKKFLLPRRIPCNRNWRFSSFNSFISLDFYEMCIISTSATHEKIFLSLRQSLTPFNLLIIVSLLEICETKRTSLLTEKLIGFCEKYTKMKNIVLVLKVQNLWEFVTNIQCFIFSVLF